MILISILLLTILLPYTIASTYTPQTPPLDTPWTKIASDSTDPWTQYPRPQMIREDWKSLNGIWSYRNASAEEVYEDIPTGDLGRGVMIPSCLESGLSGIMIENTDEHSIQYSWFQTTFTTPEDWQDQGVLLNIGAVDYDATIFVNGANVTRHVGGFTRFYADITAYIKIGEENELVVFVYDPTDAEGSVIPSTSCLTTILDSAEYAPAGLVGKQTLRPSHIFYTPCTGIWQSVFIEPIPKNGYIELVDVVASMDGQVNITVHTSSPMSQEVVISVQDETSRTIASTVARSDRPYVFTVPNPKLWAPGQPNLYNITVTLEGGDTVVAYTGLRSITKGTIDGVVRPLLNGEFIFAFGPLDQGYWPDGLYTPPTYEAMISDLEVIQFLGFNMLRKHVKVENDLFYRACDEMGILVMQDMPSLRADDVKADKHQQAEFTRQLAELINTHKSFPSIYTWVIFNEAWGQWKATPPPEFALTDLVRSLDPTRLVDSVTGWTDHGAGDYSDNHHYTDPQCGTPFHSELTAPFDLARIGFQGEFGGVGQNMSIEHLWNVPKAIRAINETYELVSDTSSWNARAHSILGVLTGQTERHSCSGGVYTQTTDVEGSLSEYISALLKHYKSDRRIIRADKAQWQRDIQGLYDAAALRSQDTVKKESIDDAADPDAHDAANAPKSEKADFKLGKEGLLPDQQGSEILWSRATRLWSSWFSWARIVLARPDL